MSEVSVWPDEVEVEFDANTSLLDVLVEAGIPIAHVCGAKARCSTCRIRVFEGV